MEKRRSKPPFHMEKSRSSLAWTLALFFLSGATSLVYEVLWTRRLSLTFGHTVLAVSTVLTVFMTGLALGSFLAGRWSDKERRRLLATGDPRGSARFLALYGILEIFIGVWAVLSLALLNGVESVYLSAARNGAEGAALYALVFLGSFFVLLPPTTAMGATLPAFTQLLVASKEDVGAWLSRIYGWNTLGACCGAALGGFFLLPNLGLKLSVGVAALGNLVIGVVALAVARRWSGGPVEGQSEPDSGEAESTSQGGWLLPIAFGMSGFAAMVYQLGWTRGLVLSIGSSTYSFAIILTAFLATLGLGSLIYKLGMGGRVPKLWHLGVLQFTIALSALLATYGIGRLPALMVKAIPALNFEFFRILAFDFGVALLLMFLPTLAMGLTFPLVTHLYTDQLSSLGRRLGEAYAANTFGAILGSFSAGFVLVPTFGAQKALLGAVLLNLTVGLIVVLADRSAGKNKARLGAVAVAGAVLVFATPSWDPTQLSAGAGIFAKAEYFLFRPAYYRDGVSATVSVGYNGPHEPYLKVNGKTDASLGVQDMAHQILTGLLPAALHAEPKSIALIGLGSGVTAASLVALDSVETVRCAELEPAIVEVVERYFNTYTENILANPKLDVEVNDGRTFILGAPEKFDLIISQPSNPWIAGIGNLYTADFYRACVDRLQPDGLMCQWFQLYSVSKYDLDLVLSTFYSVFPEGLVFQIGPGDIFLVGKMSPVAFEPSRLEALWAEEDVASWLQLIGLVEPNFMFGSYVATRAEVLEATKQWRQDGGELALNTDDRPLLEFQAPRSLYLHDPEVSAFPQSFPQLVPPGLQEDPAAVMGAIFGRLALGRNPGLRDHVQRALSKGWPLAPLADSLLRQREENISDAEGMLKAIPGRIAANPVAQLLLGDFYRAAKNPSAALHHYQKALKDAPSGSRYTLLMKAAECARASGDLDGALARYQEASSLTHRPDPLYWAGEVALIQQKVEQAHELFVKAVERDPFDYFSLHRLASIEYHRGDIDAAYKYALASYEVFPELSANVELLVNIAAARGDKSALVYKREHSILKLREQEAAARPEG